MQFRLYLINDDGRIRAAEHFLASNDDEALAIAAATWGACSDRFADYDLWQGVRRVYPNCPKWGNVDAKDLRLDLQRRIVQVEEILNADFSIFERSAKMWETYSDLRGRCQ